MRMRRFVRAFHIPELFDRLFKQFCVFAVNWRETRSTRVDNFSSFAICLPFWLFGFGLPFGCFEERKRGL